MCGKVWWNLSARFPSRFPVDLIAAEESKMQHLHCGLLLHLFFVVLTSIHHDQLIKILCDLR